MGESVADGEADELLDELIDALLELLLAVLVLTRAMGEEDGDIMVVVLLAGVVDVADVVDTSIVVVVIIDVGINVKVDIVFVISDVVVIASDTLDINTGKVGLAIMDVVVFVAMKDGSSTTKLPLMEPLMVPVTLTTS